MSKYIALRNFAKIRGMAFKNDLIEDPDPKWIALGLVEPYDGTSATALPEKVTTGATTFIRQDAGKPKNTKKK